MIAVILLIGLVGTMLDAHANFIVFCQMAAYTTWLALDYVNRTWLTHH